MINFLSSVRKAHNSGRNHLANVRDYYACVSYFSLTLVLDSFSNPLALGHDKAQNIIDQITSAYESGGPPPGGFGFGPQHLGPPPPGFGPPGPMQFGPPPPNFTGRKSSSPYRTGQSLTQRKIASIARPPFPPGAPGGPGFPVMPPGAPAFPSNGMPPGSLPPGMNVPPPGLFGGNFSFSFLIHSH